MSMHTAQHLLSALIETKLNVPTLAWSLTSYPTPSYVDLPRPLTPAEVTLVQDEANRLVFENRRVYVEVQELQSGQTGVDSGEAPSGREIGRGLPSGASHVFARASPCRIIYRLHGWRTPNRRD
jgi:misacylated tRNA(Ala) deacylase